jgi:hypothetical protein
MAMLAQDQTLLAESFSYAAGNITAVSSGAWIAHSGAGSNPVQVNASGAAVVRGGSAEDVNWTLSATPLTTGTLLASFTLDFSSGTLAASGVSTYFLHFKDATTGFRARVFLGSATVADTDLFRLGIENDGGDGAATVSYSSNLDRTSPHQVTVAYDLAAGTSRLWVNTPLTGPATVEDSVAATPLGIVGVALRQGGGATTTGNYSGLQVDNLNVTYSATVVPEPGTWALGITGLGFMGWSVRRRIASR